MTPTADVRVRRARTADRGPVLALLAKQFREHAIPLPRAVLARGVDGILGAPRRGVILVALERGKVVGVALLSYLWTLEHGGRAAWLDELYVRPAYRGRGIGGHLVTAALTHAVRVGALGVDLEVDARHARATRLYRRFGFRPLGRRRFALPLAERAHALTSRGRARPSSRA